MMQKYTYTYMSFFLHRLITTDTPPKIRTMQFLIDLTHKDDLINDSLQQNVIV